MNKKRGENLIDHTVTRKKGLRKKASMVTKQNKKERKGKSPEGGGGNTDIESLLQHLDNKKLGPHQAVLFCH